jgi:flagellar motility protein MotE (MotC chaperone)
VSASARDRQHAHQVELALEVRVAAEDQRALNVRSDATMARARTFCGALADTLREERALDALEDAKRDRVIALVTELAGLIDRPDVVIPTPIPNAAAVPLEAGKLPERTGTAVVPA